LPESFGDVPFLLSDRLGVNGGGFEVGMTQPLLDHVQLDALLVSRNAERMT